MKKNNVFDLGEFKELKEIRKCEDSYGRYLKTLSNSQLEPEVNHLLEEFSHDACGKDFSSKVRLIFNEIGSRAEGPVKNKIQKLGEDSIRLV